MNEHPRRPAAFLDRDGVLNLDKGYVSRPDDFEWCEGAIATVKELNDRGYYVFVVTNQAGVAYGYYEEAAVLELHRWMTAELAKHGAHIDAFYYCPHHPSGLREAYTMVCDCRKPAPGLLLAALREWNVDRERSFLIGDKHSDIQAAKTAGVRGLLWSGGDLRLALDEALRGGAPLDGA